MTLPRPDPRALLGLALVGPGLGAALEDRVTIRVALAYTC